LSEADDPCRAQGGVMVNECAAVACAAGRQESKDLCKEF
jgi:hypothetical protein